MSLNEFGLAFSCAGAAVSVVGMVWQSTSRRFWTGLLGFNLVFIGLHLS